MKLSKVLAAFSALGLLFTLSSCMTRMGVEPAEGFIYDHTYGTLYVNPDFMKDFDPAKLQNYRQFQTTKIVIPAPYTFGALSFAWGKVDVNRIMEEGKFKKIVYAQYRRLSVATVYTNYEITAYGE